MKLRKRTAFLLLLALVLVLHWGALGWFRDRLHGATLIQPMETPVYGRVIQPTQSSTARTGPKNPAGGIKRMAGTHTHAVNGLFLALDGPAEANPNSASDASLPTPELPALEPMAPVPPVLVQAETSKDDWPANTRLSYRLKGNYRGDLHGSAKVEWQRRSENYEVLVELRMAIFLTVTMTSQGSLSGAGLLPRVYEEKYPGSVRRIVFDGVAVKFNDGSAARQPEALQDTASQFVELSRRFSSGRQALEVGATLTLWLARPSGMDLWTYDVVAREALELPEYGSVEAFHLRPRPLANPRGPITAELWFAPSLQYLPVRIKISLGSGNFVDLMVERIEQGAPESVICPPRTDSTSAPDQNCSPARGPE